MRNRISYVFLSILLLAVVVIGALCVRYELLKRDAAKSLAIVHTTWQAANGIRVTFNEPVMAIKWSVRHKVTTIKLKKPTASVWLKTTLPQGSKSTLEIYSVETRFEQTVSERAKLTDVLPQPLTAVTNPGPWQLHVPRNGPYSIKFSAPIANRTQTTKNISFVPKVTGKWMWKNAETVDFQPNQPLSPTVKETLIIHSGYKGPASLSGQYLTANVTRPFITASDEKIVVTEKLPETLTLYKNGKVVLTSLCNTAVKGAHTPIGKFYVRSKYTHVDMKGTDPNGHHYNDKNVPWVMGLIGDIAIHGFYRASYGFPQSNGCVELPIATAKKLYSLVHVGTQVEITKA